MVHWRLRDTQQDWERKGLILPPFFQDLKLWYFFFGQSLSVRKKRHWYYCVCIQKYFSCSQNGKSNFLTPEKKTWDGSVSTIIQVSMATENPSGLCGITKSAMQLTVYDVYVYFQFLNGSPAVISVTLIDNSCSDALVCTVAIAREQTPNVSPGPAKRCFSFFF